MGTLKKFRIVGVYSVKISQLCKMIEDSIHSGKYPLDDQQKRFANSKVTNRSEFDDLKSSEIIIEVRMIIRCRSGTGIIFHYGNGEIAQE